MKYEIKKLLREGINVLKEYSSKKEWDGFLKNHTNNWGRVEFLLGDGKTSVNADFDGLTIYITHKPHKNSGRIIRKEENYKDIENFIYRLKELAFGNKQFKMTDDRNSWVEF
jgi:hypothetical protein